MNYVRTQALADRMQQGVTYVAAKDTPSSQALQERPHLPSQKKLRLQRRDLESGHLYGLMPPIPGMPVALSTHMDRSPDNSLLRGRVGHMHSWMFDDTDLFVF